MTFAPDSLKDDRAYLLATYDVHPDSGKYPADLDPTEVGIVGDVNHRGGYHCGSDRLVPNDYSAKTARDKAGLTEAASALDIGMFSVKGADGKTYDWRDLSVWIVAECRKAAPDTKDIREVIYTDDGKRVLRWDRQNGQNSPPHVGEADNSHLTHTHISRYRDAQNRRLTPLFQRWHAQIMGDDVALSDADIDKVAAKTVEKLLQKNMPIPEDWMAQFPDDPSIQDGEIGYDTSVRSGYFHSRQGNEQLDVVEAKVDQILAALAGGTPLPPPAANTSATFTGTVDFAPAPPAP